MLFHCWSYDLLLDYSNSYGVRSSSFFSKQFLYFYEGKRVSEIKQNYLIKARKRCNGFRFTDDPNSINYSGEFESNFCNIRLE